jgi:hypothetical protein
MCLGSLPRHCRDRRRRPGRDHQDRRRRPNKWRASSALGVSRGAQFKMRKIGSSSRGLAKLTAAVQKIQGSSGSEGGNEPQPTVMRASPKGQPPRLPGGPKSLTNASCAALTDGRSACRGAERHALMR